MSTVYTIDPRTDEVLNSTLDGHDLTEGQRELVKFSMWVANQYGMPDMVVVMMVPVLDAVSKFVEENYTWNGTRNFAFEDGDEVS